MVVAAGGHPARSRPMRHGASGLIRRNQRTNGTQTRTDPREVSPRVGATLARNTVFTTSAPGRSHAPGFFSNSRRIHVAGRRLTEHDDLEAVLGPRILSRRQPIPESPPVTSPDTDKPAV